MIAHSLLIGLLMGFLNQTEIASHVTERVVESFGRDGEDGLTFRPVVVPVDRVPFVVPRTPTDTIDPMDWLMVPPPARFVLLGDNPNEICLMGVVLDAIDGLGPAISFIRIRWDTPVSISLPNNSLGAFFGIVDLSARALMMRRVDSFSQVDRHSVFALRDASHHPYRGSS